MGTKYEEIYERYRARVKNYDFLDYDAITREEYQRDLHDREDDILRFNVSLTNREKNILSLGMVLHFVEPYVYNTDALQNAMNTKDFSLYSPANLLEKMTELMESTERRLKGEINLYSFRNGEISALTQ